MRRLLLIGLLAGAAVGCDRVPIDPLRTELLVTEPDLSVVFLDSDFRLRLTPDGPTRPLEVRIRSKEVDFDSVSGSFLYERQLTRGLNVFPLEVTDEDGETRLDTLYALHLPIERFPLVSPDSGVPRAEAAVATLGVDGILVSGGADATGAAHTTASTVSVVNGRVQSSESPLLAARLGHSATPVAGGALLLGGTTTTTPSGPVDFVQQAEWIGPSGTARAVGVEGAEAGPMRTGHVSRTLTLGGDQYIYLLGGRTPTAAGAAISEAVEVFRVLPPGLPDEAPGLVRVSPQGGASGFAALADAALAPVGTTGAAVFGLSDGTDAALSLRWALPGTSTFPFSLQVAPTGALATPRTQAAAVDIGGGLALVTGGRSADGTALRSLEVYAADARRTFRFPEGFGLGVGRSAHVATILSDSRILVLGGRPASGAPVVAAEAFRL